MKVNDLNAPSDFAATFGAAYRLILEDAGVNQTSIAERMGKAQSWVSERVRGYRGGVDSDMIDALAAEIGTSPQDLVRQILREHARVGRPIS